MAERSARIATRAIGFVCALPLIGLLAGCEPPAAPASAAQWTADRPSRIAVTIDAGEHPRFDLVVSVELEGASPVAGSLSAVEVDSGGRPLSTSPRVQCDAGDDGSAELTLEAPGRTAPRSARGFLIYFAEEGRFADAEASAGVRVQAGVEHAGQAALRIETAVAAWTYHTRGAGFAALEDRDGKDWLGYRPGGGPAGEFRGMPNLVYPEGYFHPGGTGCETRVTASGPLRVRLDSSCGDGAWRAHWDLFDRFARLTVTRAAHPFWFLYEGAPGGTLEEEWDYVGRSDGRRLAAGANWDDDLPAPEWVYFGDPAAPRVLWLAHPRDDPHPDAYRPMEGTMTVFGFGRRKLQPFLIDVPDTFFAGLLEATDPAAIALAIASATEPVSVRVGPVERRPVP